MCTIGDRIKNKRKELGWTQLQLAKRLNVTDRAVSKWEQNEGNPDFGLLPELARQLNVSLDYLITGKLDEPQINLDDMDYQKRAIYLIQKDDVDNFRKYGYITETILFDDYYRKLSGISSKFENEMRDSIYSHKSHKIFNAVLDEFVTLKIWKSGKFSDQLSPATLVYDNVDQFISMCVESARIDGFEAIQLRWFAINENTSTDVKPNAPKIRPKIENVNVLDSSATYLMSQSTFDLIFAENVAESVIDYFCDLTFLKREQIGIYYRPQVSFLHNAIISALYNSKRFEKLDYVMSQLNSNLDKSAIFWNNSKKDRNNHLEYYGGYIVDRRTSYSNELIYPNVSAVVCHIPLKYAMENYDIEWIRKFNNYNKEVARVFQEGKSEDILSDEDIHAIEVRSNSASSDEDIIIADRTRYGLLDYRFLDTPTTDIAELKKTLTVMKRYYDNIIAVGFIHYMEMIETWVKEKEYRKLFEFANDYQLTALEDSALKMNDDEIISIAKNLFLPDSNTIRNVFNFKKEQDYQIQRYIQNASDKSPILPSLLKRQMEIIPFVEYYKISNQFCEYCKSKKEIYYKSIQESLEKRLEMLTGEKKLLEEYNKTIGELSYQYFTELLQKKETEIFIIKLCSLMDIVMKWDYKISGNDFCTRMNTYFDNGPQSREIDDGWGYMVLDAEYEEKEVKPWKEQQKLFNRLRMQRNNIVHSEKNQVECLSLTELEQCLDFVISMIKEKKQ